jgi:prepilin-type N-terminal cleavage/methylation domain-containing protein
MRTRRGFTLMEVILAIALTVLLTGMMFSVWKGGLKARNHAYGAMDKALARRLVMKQITEDLQGAMAVSFMKLGMQGTSQEATWATVILPPARAWAAHSMLENAPIPPTDLQRVIYRLRTGEDEEGEPVIEGIERVVQKVLDVSSPIPSANVMNDFDNPIDLGDEEEELEEEEKELFDSRLLADGLNYIAFRYFDGSAWQESWTQPTLPVAVEITIGDSPLEEGVDPEEYDGDISRRVVYLPGVEQGASKRGIGGGR